MFTTKYLVEDLEAVRKKIVGEDGHWFVYGISYGATLAQAYTIKYADHVDGLVLDSAIYGTSEVTVARTQFLDLFINGIEDVRELFNEVISKFPEVKNDVLRLAFYSASNYQGRIYFPTLLNGLKGKSSLLEARTFLQKYYVAPKPMLGMAREIACREMYDYPSNEPAIEYYFPGLDADCKSYEAFKEPFDFSRSLKNLKTRTLVWGGKYDPMTPLQSMQRMHQWIANSLLWSNEFVGHGLIREKPDCAKNLLSLFISKQSDQDIKTAIASDSCQSEPQ
jgi:pimeloyl-ACP methyl ester carboxylesterase